MITIQYQCICADGFIGEFCHILELERNCEEDYCSSHGKGRYDPESGCTCECDPNEWIGDKCDIRSPCVDYSCMNTANCTLKYHPLDDAVEAVCICPSDTELVKTTIGGDHCERIETNDEMSEFIPCKESGNFYGWFMKMSNELKDTDLKDLLMIEKSCVKFDGKSCNGESVLANGWFESGKLYLVPFCECKGANSGRFCEYHRKDACDPTAVEKERGVTRENRCTSLLNGICIAPEGIPLCDCHRGYVGENCEVYDPCARNPCGKVSECIAIPDELEVKGELSAQNYRCLCGMADGIDEKNTAETKCVYTGTGNCSRASNPCNHGECLACEHDDQGDILQLCSDKEKRDGFRCVCEPGFMAPYCQTPEDACHNHLCMNGALCIAKSPFNYDCKCVPGTFGTLCEHVTDYCQAVGNRMCINGDCYEDPTTTRQFSCYCRFGYHGRNCELKYTLFEINMHWIKENSQYVIPAFSMMCTFMLLFVIYFSCIIKRRLREEKGDDSVHLESIRYRKLKVAMEQKMNVVRKKVRHLLLNLLD
ncbi:hypothetical protein Angca_007784 [Angiostrongylus cantonensis]|nr:hypothetical protein Angca_007784 [Angiostrongylus cantonensis]